MHSQLRTYYFRKLVNTIVDSTLDGPSLADMVHRHVAVEWRRLHEPPYYSVYRVHDDREVYWDMSVVDARGYTDDVYHRGLALLRIGVNGSLVSPDDEDFAARVFAGRPFRTCPRCRQPFARWLEYYGHIKTAHWDDAAIS